MGHVQNDISSLFITAEETTEAEVVCINGNIPKWLRGSYLQIGPGKLDFPNFTVNDWLDGYGIITKLEIKDLKNGPVVSLEKKYVQTEALKKAIVAGKPFYTEFGTVSQTDVDKGIFSKIVSTFSRDDMSDNCSASLYQIGSHVCAAAATCYFQEIDPKTLETKDRYDAKKYFGQNGFGVHPLTDQNGDIWNMGFTVLPTLKYNIVKISCKGNDNSNSNAKLEKICQKGKTIASISSRWSGAFAFNHSFGMTDNHIIFVEQPYIIKVSRVLSAKIKGYAVKDWLEWQPEDKNRFYLIEKESGKVLNLEIMSDVGFFFLHFVNCYQDGNQIVVDIATSINPSTTEATSLQKLRNNIQDPVECSQIQRFIIPLEVNSKDSPEHQNLITNLPINSKASAVRKGNIFILTPDKITETGVDRLSINRQFLGKKYTHVFTGGTFLSSTNKNSQFFNSVCKVNVDTKEVKRWFESCSHFPGEPLFISRGDEAQNEDDGVVICPVETVDSKEDNFLLFLDAKSFVELGRASFKNRIPGAMHGLYLPAA